MRCTVFCPSTPNTTRATDGPKNKQPFHITTQCSKIARYVWIGQRFFSVDKRASVYLNSCRKTVIPVEHGKGGTQSGTARRVQQDGKRGKERMGEMNEENAEEAGCEQSRSTQERLRVDRTRKQLLQVGSVKCAALHCGTTWRSLAQLSDRRAS